MDLGAILELAWPFIAALVALTGVSAWLLKKGVDKIAAKGEEVAEKGADILDGLAETAKKAGLEKVGVVLEEASDPIDEFGDFANVIEEMTKNQDFTAAKFKEAYQEGKEVIVEGIDFVVKVIKKK